jgi:hypothetical protein
MEGSLVAYKVFTNGSTLQASEVNDNLMKQAVATFSNAAARTAAISSPVEGQMTYLEDVNRYDHWNGSAWVSPFGLTHIATSTFAGVSSASMNNVFTSVYDNYKIVVNLDSSSSTTFNRLRFRASGSDNSTSNYINGEYFVGVINLATAGSSNAVTDDAFFYAGTNAGAGMAAHTEVFSPATPQFTKIVSAGAGRNLVLSGGVFLSTEVFDGFTLFPGTGTITGAISVFGYRKS